MNVEIKSREDLEKNSGMKVLTVEQMGDALMESLKYDKVSILL